MKVALKQSADLVLRGIVEQEDRESSVPSVVAMATDREGNIYEGAFGGRPCASAARTRRPPRSRTYWIDRQNDLGRFWATRIFPFADPVSFEGYMDFETAVYDSANPTARGLMAEYDRRAVHHWRPRGIKDRRSDCKRTSAFDL